MLTHCAADIKILILIWSSAIKTGNPKDGGNEDDDVGYYHKTTSSSCFFKNNSSATLDKEFRGELA